MATLKLTILAGPNGSGKTTAYQTLRNDQENGGIEFINIDEIAKNLPKIILGEKARYFAAGRQGIKRIQKLISDRKSFVFETTLASNQSIRVIEKAKAAGFRVELYFVTLQSADMNVERVRRRVQHGGHDVPENDIRERYNTSLDGLTEAIRIADEIVIADNSYDREPLIVFKVKNGRVILNNVREGVEIHRRLSDVVRDALYLDESALKPRPSPPRTKEMRIPRQDYTVSEVARPRPEPTRERETSREIYSFKPPGFR